MVVSGGHYIYGFRVNVATLKRLLKDKVLFYEDNRYYSNPIPLIENFCNDEDPGNFEDDATPEQKKLFYEVKCALKCSIEGLEIYQTPHECRWTDIDGECLFFGQVKDIYFGFQQLSIPVFDKKDQIDSLAEKVGVKTGFLFAPNDCNCCS